MDVSYEYTQTRAYVINKGSMNLYDQVYIFMEANMSKGVGEHLSYLCILIRWLVFAFIKEESFFYDNPGYLPAVLSLWS